MHPHRVLLKSILGYGACQALSLVIYACYSLRERVHRPSFCWDHKDHTALLNMKILRAGSIDCFQTGSTIGLFLCPPFCLLFVWPV